MAGKQIIKLFLPIALLITIVLSQVGYAENASLKGVKLKVLFYNYKNSSAIHETLGTPTKDLFTSYKLDSLNKTFYLNMNELNEILAPNENIKKELAELKKKVNEDYRIKIILWEKKLPTKSSVNNTRLIPLYPRFARDLAIMSERDGELHDLTKVTELSDIPLIDSLSKETIDLSLPTPAIEPHQYYIGVYLVKAAESPTFEGNKKVVAVWYNVENGEINPLSKNKNSKFEKDLTPFLNNKGGDLNLYVTVTNYSEFLLPKSRVAESTNKYKNLAESLRFTPTDIGKNRKGVFFIKDDTGKVVKELVVQTGDIAVRLGEDINIAVGLGPIPNKFENDQSGIFNFDLTTETIAKLNKSTNGAFPIITVEELFLKQVHSELGKPFENSFATYSGEQLLTQENRTSRDALRTIDFSGDNFDDPFLKYYNRLDPSPAHLSPYTFKLIDFIDFNALREKLHYYPGTIFFSHSGMISVEEDANGKTQAWIYDAYPSTMSFPYGIRRVPFSEMFGAEHGAYGAIVRLRDDLDLGGHSAFEIAQQAIIQARLTFNESINSNPVKKIYFDGEFDWKNDITFGCSEFVWDMYGIGSTRLGLRFNLVPNLSMLRMPTEFAKHIGNSVELFLQISPQDLATSPYVKRVADFDAQMLNEDILKFSETGEAQDLSIKANLPNPRTGHEVIRIY